MYMYIKCIFRYKMYNVYVCEVAQSRTTLCDPTDCSLPGTSVKGIFQATVLEWVAISFSWRSSQSRYQTQVSRISGRQMLYCLNHKGSQCICIYICKYTNPKGNLFYILLYYHI